MTIYCRKCGSYATERVTSPESDTMREIAALEARIRELEAVGSMTMNDNHALQARIAELEGDGYTGHFGDMIDIKNKRIRELEAGLMDALIDCEFSMEPKLHSDLKALLGEGGCEKS